MSAILDAAIALANGAGAILREAYGHATSEVSHKSTLIDLVTDADRASESYLLAELTRRYPDHSVLAEESGKSGQDGPYRWVIDPLDGTVNFAHHLPIFAVLLAVQARRADDFETVAGVTYDPMRDELFAAERGQGATKNGVPIHVSQTRRLIDALVTTGFMYDRLGIDDDNHREFCRLNLVSRGVRRLGSAGLDLAYVACGRFDASWECDLKPWDMAGGALLVEEAGGRVTTMLGAPFLMPTKTILSSNGQLHSAMLAALRSARHHPTNSREGLEELLPADLASSLRTGRDE